MKLVGRVALLRLESGSPVRLHYAPFHVLVAMVDGVPFAIEDSCNHAGASLSEGDVRNGRVRCPMHGYVFDLATGRLVEPLGLCGDQRAFVARLEGADVVVWDPGADVTIIDT